MNISVTRFVSIGVSGNRPVLVALIFLALAVCLPVSYAQGTASVDTTNTFPTRQSSPVETPSTSTPQFPKDDSPYEIEADSVKLEFLGDYRRIFNGDYESLSTGGFAILFAPTDQDSFGVLFELGLVQLAGGSAAAANINEPVFMQAGLVARHYFTPSHVLLRPYITLNANYIEMSWDYQTPVNFYGRQYGDSVEGVDASAGVGLSLHLHRHMNLFGEFSGGGVGVLPQTDAGLDNNFMGSFGYVSVKAGFSVVF